MAFTDYRVRNLRFNMFDSATWADFAPPFIGLDNFWKILTNQLNLENYNFWRLLLFNITWTITNIFFHVTLGVAIAVALNAKRLIGRKVYRALFVLPWAMPGYITALTWKNMYDPRFGAFNQMLAAINQRLGTNFPVDTRWIDVSQPPIGGRWRSCRWVLLRAAGQRLAGVAVYDGGGTGACKPSPRTCTRRLDGRRHRLAAIVGRHRALIRRRWPPLSCWARS